MDHNALAAHQSRLFAEASQLMQAKNADYSQPTDALANFKLGSRFGLTPLQTLGNYMFKHIDAIEAYIRNGKVESEPIDGRILDAINYLTLLSALIHENDNPKPIEAPVYAAEPRCQKCNVPPGHSHASWCPYNPGSAAFLPLGGP